MSPSKRIGKVKDSQKIDAYDPQMDPDLYDGYKFHKTYETIRTDVVTSGFDVITLRILSG